MDPIRPTTAWSRCWRPDDPVDQELVAFIEAMSEDEQVELVTLTWLGRATVAWKTGMI
jgi:hypothetical protein